jgi:ADP-dependent NAD(P)H-hydrate dehydratase / NAD(P)H-hydrate epimerase
VRKLVTASQVPVVLDADGINAYKGAVEDLKGRRGELLMTPHAGEWSRLFGELPADPMEAITAIRHKATSFNITILYKGSPTIVAVPRGRAYVLPFGTSALATAGSGDVLTGILASLIAQGCTVADAAVLGAYLHGRAGELAAEELTDYGVIARDVVKRIPAAIKELIGSTNS